MKYNGIDYNDYLIEQALENMGESSGSLASVETRNCR